jgi:hypothetical protein
MQTPSQKHQNLTPIGSRFRSPFFLCLIQNLKAVAMGVVAAITFFWPNRPNPAIMPQWLRSGLGPFMHLTALEGAEVILLISIPVLRVNTGTM